MGSSKNYVISLPQRLNSAILGLILDSCLFHQVPGQSNKERKTFDEKFMRMDTKRLCKLTSAADSLQLRPLPDDLTESVEIEAEHVDERSVNDLLSFINGIDEDAKGSRSCKNKKKNQRKNDNSRNSSANNSNRNNNKDEKVDSVLTDCQNAEVNATPVGTRSIPSKFQVTAAVACSPKFEFDDADIDDDLDPAMKEQLDREVEDFACRLNSAWPQRMQEILSLSQGSLASMSLNGNGSLHRYSGFERR